MPPRKGSAQRAPQPERLRYQATLLDGEKAADVFPQQFGEALVEVGADGDVTLVARVSGGALGDHALALFEAVALELHGAGLQSAIGGDHQKAQSGLAAGGSVVGEVLARGLERTGRVEDPVGGIAALFHAEKPRADFGELLRRAGEVIAAAGAARRVGAVAEIHAPLPGLVRDSFDLSQ